MITGKQNELDQIAQANRCPHHDNPLVVAWHAKENSYVIRCGDGHYPEELEALVSRTKQYKRGELAKVDQAFNLMPKTDLATGELLPPVVIEGILAYAERYNLDAYRGHIVVMYGQPYIGIDGYLYHANRTKEPYQLKSRPLSDEERKLYKITIEDDHAWIAEVIKKDGSIFSGQGIVTAKEMTAKSKKNPERLRSPVVAAFPWQLAQKRAEWQAMRRAFPIGETEEESQ